MSVALTGNHDLNYSTTGAAGLQGRLNLKVANTYTGNTNLSGLAYLLLPSTAVNNSLPTTTLNMGTAASTFRYGTSNQSQEIAGLTGTSTSATVTGLNLTGDTLKITTKTGITTSYAGTIANTAANGLSIVIGGSGTQTFSNTGSSYTGTTTINGGTLSISTLANGGSNSSIGKAPNTADQLILNGGTLKYTGGAVSTDRLFSLQSSSTIDASGTSTGLNFTNTGAMGFNGGTAAKTLTLTGTNTGSNTIAAVIADNTAATSLTKSSTGTWVLTGANTYTGVTTITGGTLKLTGSGSIANSSSIIVGDTKLNSSATLDVSALAGITIGSGNSLGGHGIVKGNVTIAGGSLNPGNSIGTLTINSGNLTIGGTLNIDLDPTGSGSSDLVQGVNVLDITAATVNFVPTATLDDSAYVFAKYTSLNGSQFASANTPAGYGIDYNYQGLNQIALLTIP